MKIYTSAIKTILFALLLTALTISAIAKDHVSSTLVFRVTALERSVDSIWSNDFRPWQPPHPVPMFASYGRQDIAWTDGSAIYYNPYIFSSVPPRIRAFFVAHEYGHVYGMTSNENVADIFAARVYAQTDKSVCEAFAWWMTNFSNGGDMTHLPSPIRAQIVARECGI